MHARARARLLNRTYVEYVVCKPEDLARIQEALDAIDAAALPLAFLTGAQVIELSIRPRTGEIILVMGAIGGVGRIPGYLHEVYGVVLSLKSCSSSLPPLSNRTLCCILDGPRNCSHFS
jgi:NADPH:quinone reductase-like Zn-dependent oxidoreductase